MRTSPNAGADTSDRCVQSGICRPVAIRADGPHHGLLFARARLLCEALKGTLHRISWNTLNGQIMAATERRFRYHAA